MILQWKEFYINLDKFNTFLKKNIVDSDGIIASPENFEIVEVNPFTPQEINLIMNYYDTLVPEVEDGETN